MPQNKHEHEFRSFFFWGENRKHNCHLSCVDDTRKVVLHLSLILLNQAVFFTDTKDAFRTNKISTSRETLNMAKQSDAAG